MDNDLISRKALLEKKREMELCWAVTERDILDAPAVVPAQKWIPASEPPNEWHDDENGVAINYLVFCPDLGIDIGNYVKPADMWFCLGVPVPVTHWMPMPESPKENMR